MKVCIVGGLNRKEKDYIRACKDIGCKAKVFNTLTNNFEESIKCTECVILMTSLASHNMAGKAKRICKRYNIPFICTDKTSPCALSGDLKEFMCCGDCVHADKCKVRN